MSTLILTAPLASTSAPALNKSMAMSLWPMRDTSWRGVHPVYKGAIIPSREDENEKYWQPVCSYVIFHFDISSCLDQHHGNFFTSSSTSIVKWCPTILQGSLWAEAAQCPALALTLRSITGDLPVRPHIVRLTWPLSPVGASWDRIFLTSACFLCLAAFRSLCQAQAVGWSLTWPTCKGTHLT